MVFLNFYDHSILGEQFQKIRQSEATLGSLQYDFVTVLGLSQSTPLRVKMLICACSQLGLFFAQLTLMTLSCRQGSLSKQLPWHLCQMHVSHTSWDISSCILPRLSRAFLGLQLALYFRSLTIGNFVSRVQVLLLDYEWGHYLGEVMMKHGWKSEGWRKGR